jgi:SAM-dependent methyltransferase
VGVDRDDALPDIARLEHSGIPNLRFERGDATTLKFHREFDIVTAAPTLQWVGEPAAAVSSMAQTVRSGGIVLVLDYSHTRNCREPEPPREFMVLYEAFPAWRDANQWDNAMADHLPELFRHAGLTRIENHQQDEIVERGDADFSERAALWSEVIENVGRQLASARFCTGAQIEAAWEVYPSFVEGSLSQQTLAMSAVVGRVP